MVLTSSNDLRGVIVIGFTSTKYEPISFKKYATNNTGPHGFIMYYLNTESGTSDLIYFHSFLKRNGERVRSSKTLCLRFVLSFVVHRDRIGKFWAQGISQWYREIQDINFWFWEGWVALCDLFVDTYCWFGQNR